MLKCNRTKMTKQKKESSDVMKIAAYARVSTEKESQVESFEKQIEFFNEFTKKTDMNCTSYMQMKEYQESK